MDVAIVRWPGEEARWRALRQQGAPRLLLVDFGPPPLSDGDCLEDWVRVPAPEADVHARMEALARRASRHDHEVPTFDDDGLLRFGSAWASIPPVEKRLLGMLLDRYGAVVTSEVLARACWPDGAHGTNTLGVHILRLRRRIAPVGLAIKNVRSRGYLLEPSDPVQQAVRHA